VYDRAAKIIADAGFKVIRDPILGQVRYRAENYDTNYLNWLGTTVLLSRWVSVMQNWVQQQRNELKVIFQGGMFMSLKC
jgi:hypothetical protein